ncbi:hypothetical protein ACOSP7_016384 [Xanthoceras sorbifolium]
MSFCFGFFVYLFKTFKVLYFVEFVNFFIKITNKKTVENRAMICVKMAILGRFGAKFAGPNRPTEKRKPEDRVLKSTVGRFSNGVLDVKHMLNPTSSRDTGSV